MPQAEFEPRAVQPVASRHTDYFFLFFVCTLSALLCPDCPGFAFCPYCTTHTTQTYMPPAGFEPQPQ